MSKYRSIESQIHYAANSNFKEGTKKREYKIENGQEMTSKIFSYSEKSRILDVAKNLQNYLKENVPTIKMVADIRADHVQSFLNSKTKNCTQNTINSYGETLKKIEMICNRTYRIDLNWSSKIVIPVANTKESQFRGAKNQMTDVAYEKIIDYIKGQKYSESGRVIELQEHLGLRINEITQLKKSNIDFEHNFIKIKNTKGGKLLIRDMNPSLRELLADTIKRGNGDNRLFTVENKSVQQYLRRATDKLGLQRYNFHNIRALIGQKYYDQLRKNGFEMKVALQKTSEFLNHTTSRERMLSKSYIKLS